MTHLVGWTSLEAQNASAAELISGRIAFDAVLWRCLFIYQVGVEDVELVALHHLEALCKRKPEHKDTNRLAGRRG